MESDSHVNSLPESLTLLPFFPPWAMVTPRDTQNAKNVKTVISRQARVKTFEILKIER